MSIWAQLFRTFFKISLFTLGGGYNMIPLMQHEMAVHDWLSSERFLDILAISEITPGPLAVNLATFTGYQVAGIPGAMVATLAVGLPGAMILLVLGRRLWGRDPRPGDPTLWKFLMPALVGMLAATCLRLGLALLPEPDFFSGVQNGILFAAVLALSLWKNIHPALLLIGAALAGMAGAFL